MRWVFRIQMVAVGWLAVYSLGWGWKAALCLLAINAPLALFIMYREVMEVAP